MGWFGGQERTAAFAAQFEPRGKGCIYRQSMRGEPYALTMAERDDFVAAYARRLRRGRRTLAAVLALFALGAIWWGRAVMAAGLGGIALGGVGLVLAFFALFFRGIWTAPARTLEARYADKVAQSGAEARKTYLGRTRYAQFVGVAFAALFLFMQFAQTHDVTTGWARLAPILLGVVLCVLAWRIFQKWRVGRAERPSDSV